MSDELQVSIDALQEHFPPEDLHEDLEGYIEESGLWTMLRHPLVFSIPYHKELNHQINKSYQYKLEALDRAEAAEDWHTYIWLHERPYRLDALLEVMDRMPDAEYWETLARIWIDSENIQQNKDVWVTLLGSKRGGRESFMSEADREALAALPEQFTVYQGHTNERDDGWSWTTSKETAEWFARRFALLEKARPKVTYGYIRKSDVVAYLLGRNKSEIITNPRHVHGQITKYVRKEK